MRDASVVYLYETVTYPYFINSNKLKVAIISFFFLLLYNPFTLLPFEILHILFPTAAITDYHKTIRIGSLLVLEVRSLKSRSGRAVLSAKPLGKDPS